MRSWHLCKYEDLYVHFEICFKFHYDRDNHVITVVHIDKRRILFVSQYSDLSNSVPDY